MIKETNVTRHGQAHNPHEPHDLKNERRTLVLLAIGFGLVGPERWMIAPQSD